MMVTVLIQDAVCLLDYRTDAQLCTLYSVPFCVQICQDRSKDAGAERFRKR